MKPIQDLLNRSAALHYKLCPRQVLGVRMGLAGADALGIDVPRQDKRLLVIVETDGCFVGGIEAATGCSVSHRTLRVEDYGKVAATFVDKKDEYALRLSPKPDIRQRAKVYAPGQTKRYFAQLEGYQFMPVDELFDVQEVTLAQDLEKIVGYPGRRVNCFVCGEEIINQREVRREGLVYCRPCTGDAYYHGKVATTWGPVKQVHGVSLHS